MNCLSNIFWGTYNYISNYDEYTFFKANTFLSEHSYSRKFDTLYKLKNLCSECELHLVIKIPKLKYMTKLRLKCRKNYNQWKINVIKDFECGPLPEKDAGDVFFCITDDSVLHYTSRNDFYCKCTSIYEL
jgi:hypothetical protein